MPPGTGSQMPDHFVRGGHTFHHGPFTTHPSSDNRPVQLQHHYQYHQYNFSQNSGPYFQVGRSGGAEYEVSGATGTTPTNGPGPGMMDQSGLYFPSQTMEGPALSLSMDLPHTQYVTGEAEGSPQQSWAPFGGGEYWAQQLMVPPQGLGLTPQLPEGKAGVTDLEIVCFGEVRDQRYPLSCRSAE
jgi:hypothetical protein